MTLESAADGEFIRERLGSLRKILDYYKSEYAQENGLLANLDKWCVVEWPANWRDGYDVDISEGKVCKTMHNVINAWYIGAIKSYNKTPRKLGEPEYPGEPFGGLCGTRSGAGCALRLGQGRD